MSIEGIDARVARRIEVYRKVSKSPHHASLLGRFEGLGRFPDSILQEHYRNTAETLERCSRIIQAANHDT